MKVLRSLMDICKNTLKSNKAKGFAMMIQNNTVYAVELGGIEIFKMVWYL